MCSRRFGECMLRSRPPSPFTPCTMHQMSWMHRGVDAQVRDEVYDIEQEEKLKVVSLPTPQSRVGTAKLHISRMANERRNVRRNVGPRVMHLSK